MSVCEKCGHHVKIGDWPFCGKTGGPHERPSFAVQDDTIPGGARWMHNLGDEPVWVEKKSELKQIMAERGLIHAERATYCKDDQSPWATRTCLRPGQRDPFIHPAGFNE